VPDDAERIAARKAAAALRVFLKHPESGGALSKIHGSARPQYWWSLSWENLPGLRQIIAGSTLARTAEAKTTYEHDLLPGWEYQTHEVDELLSDLDRLASGKGQPTAPTRNPKPKPTKQGSLSL
jgi:hypothetical protein